jgi:hypothetical protein
MRLRRGIEKGQDLEDDVEKANATGEEDAL